MWASYCGRKVSEKKMWVHTDHTPVFIRVYCNYRYRSLDINSYRCSQGPWKTTVWSVSETHVHGEEQLILHASVSIYWNSVMNLRQLTVDFLLLHSSYFDLCLFTTFDLCTGTTGLW